MKVLGVDPGLVRTGWAVVESRDGGYHLLKSGLIVPRPEGDLAERLAEGFASFSAVLGEEQPDVMVLEDIFSTPAHPRAALRMAHMRGVLCLAAGQRSLPVQPMTATTVKQRVTGNGHASKSQVQQMVLRLCNVREREMRADVSDAIALAVAGLNQLERGLRLGVGSPVSGFDHRATSSHSLASAVRGQRIQDAEIPHRRPDAQDPAPGTRA